MWKDTGCRSPMSSIPGNRQKNPEQWHTSGIPSCPSRKMQGRDWKLPGSWREAGQEYTVHPRNKRDPSQHGRRRAPILKDVL